MLNTKFKKVVLGSVVVALCGAAQVASAHTGIKDKVFMAGQGNTGLAFSGSSVTPSNTAYNAFTITHGCATNAIAEGTVGTVRKNVIAMGAVFPDFAKGASKVYRYKTGSIVANTVGVDGTVLTGVAATSMPAIDDSLDGDIGTTATAPSLGLGLVSPNLFGNVVFPVLNAAGATRGYYTYNVPKTIGLQENIISTTGLSPFKFTVPVFNPTSCAANLIVRAAVSNWCQTGAATKNSPDRKDVWIGTDTGSVLYSMMGPNAAVMPNSVATLGGTGETLANEQGNGKSFWPAFTVHRDPATIPASCAETYDVVVQPTGSDIDTMLAIPSSKGAFY